MKGSAVLGLTVACSFRECNVWDLWEGGGEGEGGGGEGEGGRGRGRGRGRGGGEGEGKRDGIEENEGSRKDGG